MAQATMRQRGRRGPGGARWLALGGAAVVVLVLTFALGILVGRQSARQTPPAQVVAEPVKKPAPPPRRSGLVEPGPERPPLQEKLTFYQTLTAPLGARPASSKADMAARPEAPKPRPASERADRAAAGVRPAAGASRADKPATPARETPPVQRIAGEGRRGDWAVQAGVFKDRGQADGVRKQLADSGFDAYLLAVPAEGGEVRYKVRVGSFKTRDEATRMAGRVRQERSLTAFVTSR
jgi:cell division protein FtsN